MLKQLSARLRVSVKGQNNEGGVVGYGLFIQTVDYLKSIVFEYVTNGWSKNG